ncbi:adapter molecule Crk-like [Panonychus citri]|uniref:adapter molecule Crk-like n=1 Tax=Panonychus citri TaxID=50023 RepID=UPI0023070CA0|nr:adapter molecule Crk-like [Panonychus citri]
MAANFDPYDKNSWYFGSMTRQEAIDLLNAENEVGVFLVRNSSSILGDLVLCVREDLKVSHYIINKVQQYDQTRFRMGDQMFPDIPSLLSFYKIHLLDTTKLKRPATKRSEKVRAKYDFVGSGDDEDLPFRRNEILTIVSKDEDHWWTARNRLGKTGCIPVNYVEPYDDTQNENTTRTSSPIPSQTKQIPAKPQYNTPQIQRQLPAMAKVTQARVPNAYDKTALKLEVGDIIKVIKTKLDGQWEGELNGKIGHFPFNHVEFIDTENPEEEDTNS